MQAPVHHIIGFTSIIRERLLPIPGTVLVRQGQKVSAGDVVAEASMPREHVLLDVSRSLRIHPKNAEELVRFKVGDEITADAEIAVGKGLFPKTVRSPKDGRVVATGGGMILIETGSSKIEVRAGIPGMVTQVIPERGAVIQAGGSLIQGVWGNGRVDSGMLVNLAEKPDSVLTAGQLDVSFRGAVILAGMVKDVEALKVAAELPVRGLILSSLSPSLLPAAREMKYPIMVTEGFGDLPMNSVAHKLLSTNAKREIAVNAEVFDRYTGAKPEAVIPLPVSSEPPTPNEVEPFAVGLQVRLRRPPSMGMIGSISNLLPGLTTLPSGLRAPAAEVKLENGESVTVPLVNLEVVG